MSKITEAATNAPRKHTCGACNYNWYSHERTPCPRCHPEHCPDCAPYQQPHTVRCRAHPDHDGAPKE